MWGLDLPTTVPVTDRSYMGDDDARFGHASPVD
jgi:hypothetical protein